MSFTISDRVTPFTPPGRVEDGCTLSQATRRTECAYSPITRLNSRKQLHTNKWDVLEAADTHQEIALLLQQHTASATLTYLVIIADLPHQKDFQAAASPLSPGMVEIQDVSTHLIESQTSKAVHDAILTRYVPFH